jgi:probable HAF family extracellular repeat protein
MIIIGVDFHPEFQQIASVDTDSGEFLEKRLAHREEAEKFYRALAGQKVRVGMEASGHARWFERLLGELQFELGIGDAAEIRTKRVRKQKTDRQDAQLILRLLLEDRFPRIWVPSWENRDLRQLLWHRHRMVQARTRIMNQLQAVALNEGLCCKKRLWRERGRQQLESFRLAPWASRRRRDLLELMDRLNPTIAELSQAIEQEVEKCPAAQRLATHPGVGPLTALAFVLIIGRAERFQCGKQVASYLGLVPLEESSGNRRRLGHITKQGSSMLRFLLVEAALVSVRSIPEWRNKYFHLMMRRGGKIAKVAMARRLAVQMFWMRPNGTGGGNIAFDINNQGQVVGNSDLLGDTTSHAFLWTRRTGMQDLGTLSGDVASASISINDAGSVIGASIDASENPRAFLWENGVMTDLNTLIAGDSPLYLLTGCSINSRGEITGLGLTSTGEIHTYLASPTHGVATSESASQGVISRRVLGDDARKLLKEQLRFGRSGVGLMGPQ